MEFGIWYPNRFPSGGNPSLKMLVDITKEAERLGYAYMTGGENFETMDLTTVLSAVAPFTGRMKLVTAILLLVQRGPVPSAKFLATLDHLTEGRVIAGIASGSSFRDWRYVDINRTDMWPRFDEATEALRALLTPDSKPFIGKYYSTEGITLYPYPVQKPLPIWIRPNFRRIRSWAAMGCSQDYPLHSLRKSAIIGPCQSDDRAPCT